METQAKEILETLDKNGWTLEAKENPATLLWGAYQVSKNVTNATAYLIAAWGIATGALFLSFISQFKYYQIPAGDPGIFSTTFVVVAKALIFTYMIIGLIKAVKANVETSDELK